MLRRLLLAAVVAVGSFAAITMIALEGREVVVLRTSDGAGATRETRAWIADEDGHAWVESANPERPFFQHILARPEIEVVRGGEVLELRAVPLPPEVGHPLIRRMLAEKYGWADTWIGLIADTSQSTAVRLDPR
jgi:hypothetical protein